MEKINELNNFVGIYFCIVNIYIKVMAFFLHNLGKVFFYKNSLKNRLVFND